MLQNEQKITFDGVSVKYGDNIVFDNFCAAFPQGINVILGRSGCGKTTLLNVVTGLVEYAGTCSSIKPSIVFSEPTLAPVSVENNVKMVLGKRCAEQVDRALTAARIYDKRKQSVLTLSDGEKQRVALARAFACNRSVMLLDEPFSRLDYGVRKQLYDTLINYLKTSDITALLVTHDVDEALTLADRIYFLDGKPCVLSKVAEFSVPQTERDIYDAKHNAVRLQLHNLFTATANN